MKSKIKGCFLQHVGGRKNQEDALAIGVLGKNYKVLQEKEVWEAFEYELDEGEKFLMAVADGMGGLAAGDLASKLLCELLQETFLKIEPTKEEVLNALKELQRKLVEKLEEIDFLIKAGTTLSGVLISNNKFISFNVGDSRVYLIREEKVIPLSEDHNLATAEYKKGKPWKEAKRFSHILYFGYGTAFNITSSNPWEIYSPQIHEDKLQKGDAFFLSTDGLIDALQYKSEKIFGEEKFHKLVEEELINLLKTKNCRTLFEKYKKAYSDNITFIFAEIL
jgi:serine/threonine protein phosphatase PrpC